LRAAEAPLPDRPPPSGLSRKEKERRFRIDLVLDAAWEVLAEKSYDATTVEDIARAAEISVGTLYQLFRSKEDIYYGLLERQQRRFFEAVHEHVDRAGERPRDQVFAMVRAHMHLFGAYRKQWKYYLTASNAFSRELRDELAHNVYADHRAFLRRLTEICQRGLDSGEFRAGVSAELLAVALLWLPHSFLTFIFDREDADVAALVPSALEAAARMVGLASEQPPQAAARTKG
jgi:AcrR family transcriptional regulator